MTTFHVQDMTCGHCIQAITRAIRAVDAMAAVDVDLATHRVRIDGATATAAALGAAITEAGYTPRVEAAAVTAASPAPAAARSGCCCG